MLKIADDFHSLIVQSPPGWGKSTAIMQCLEKLKIPYHAVGSYSTPLALYRALHQNARKVVVLDDCAGLLNNDAALSILSAATWSSVGHKERQVTWESSKFEDEDEELRRFIFRGKIIMITNVLPDTEAVRRLQSRSFFYKLSFPKNEIIQMLRESSKNKKYFPDQKTTKKVVDFLLEKLETHNYEEFNLRTLKQGVLFATVDPKNWKEPLENLLPEVTPEEYVRQLSKSRLKVVDQLKAYMSKTGGSRRNFFYVRSQLNLASPKMQKAGKKRGKK
jgi:hypothetical protein